MAVQRSAGNRAARQLLGREAAPRPEATVQRNPRDRPSPTSTSPAQRWDGAGDDRSPDQRVEDATWVGFNAWWADADADAFDALGDEASVAVVLRSPYDARLGMLAAGLERQQNLVANGVTALRNGVPAPFFTDDPLGHAHRLEDTIQALRDVCDGWRAIVASGIFELLARVGEAQLRYVQQLRDELRECQRELNELSRIFSDPATQQALAQFGINLAISAALVAITVVNPVVGIGLAVAGAATQLTLDGLLGPSGPGADSFTAAGAATAGSAAENLAGKRTAMRIAGRRLGIAGAVAGSVIDGNEVYQTHKTRLARVGARMDQIDRQLYHLRHILLYPEQARAIIGALRAHGERLREHGQLVLETAGQR
jgi:hypothetical protein